MMAAKKKRAPMEGAPATPGCAYNLECPCVLGGKACIGRLKKGACHPQKKFTKGIFAVVERRAANPAVVHEIAIRWHRNHLG
jgi:hypothetical protein